MESKGNQAGTGAMFWLVRTCLQGLLGFAFPRILILAGVPLEEGIVAMTGYLPTSAQITDNGTAFFVAALITFIAVYLVDLRFQVFDKLVSKIRPNLALSSGLAPFGGTTYVVQTDDLGVRKSRLATRTSEIWNAVYEAESHDDVFTLFEDQKHLADKDVLYIDPEFKEVWGAFFDAAHKYIYAKGQAKEKAKNGDDTAELFLHANEGKQLDDSAEAVLTFLAPQNGEFRHEGAG